MVTPVTSAGEQVDPPAPQLLVERGGAVAVLTLNRPRESNSLSLGLRDALADAIAAIERDASAKAVLLRAAGRHFCVGGDVKAMAEGDSASPAARLSRMRSWQPLILALMRLDRPVVAAVDGAAFGAGFGLALLADFVLVSTRARFCMAFQRVGLVPDFGASYTLARVVGLQRARELMLSAREVGAQEAVKLGIALECVEPEQLQARAAQLAAALAQASPVALGLTKRMLGASLASRPEDMLEMEATAQSIAATSPYALEAFDRFARKEPPLFRWPGREG